MQAVEDFSILLVDDDPTAIRILSRMLSNFAPLRFATSGRVALKLARESVPDLVLLDIDMPELSGFEVCKAFSSDTALAQVPIILVSSHESPQLATLGLQLGAADFISKPPNEQLVLARVRTFQRIKQLSDTLLNVATLGVFPGAMTRRQFEKTLMREWVRSQRSGLPLALLIAGLDDFATYNTEFGEEQGDRCLSSVAGALRTVASRAPDVIGRYEGGKFALLLPETDLPGATAVAQRAIDAVDSLQIPHAASKCDGRLVLSVGGGYRSRSLAIVGDPVPDSSQREALAAGVPDNLIAAAVQALKSAKSGGGHRARFIDVATLTADQTA